MQLLQGIITSYLGKPATSNILSGNLGVGKSMATQDSICGLDGKEMDFMLTLIGAANNYSLATGLQSDIASTTIHTPETSLTGTGTVVMGSTENLNELNKGLVLNILPSATNIEMPEKQTEKINNEITFDLQNHNNFSPSETTVQLGDEQVKINQDKTASVSGEQNTSLATTIEGIVSDGTGTDQNKKIIKDNTIPSVNIKTEFQNSKSETKKIDTDFRKVDVNITHGTSEKKDSSAAVKSESVKSPVEASNLKLKGDLLLQSGIMTKPDHHEKNIANNNEFSFPSNHVSNQPSDNTISQARPPDTIQKPFENVLSQLVEKATVGIKKGHASIEIHLKPDVLGRVKLNISTHDKQVTIRFFAETLLVKEIIEKGFDQLKMDLHQQGLDIDKFEVFVGQDSQHENGYGEPLFGEAGDTSDMQGSELHLLESEDGETEYQTDIWSKNEPGVINFFA